ncbi:MAG: hypothetical protein DYG89_01310 [Caldilinea sp. CFX5]|nr:hypothetical protein [Caldilinea sp. CFX5]
MVQPTTERETPTLSAGAFFLIVLLLLAAGLWLCYRYRRLGISATRRSRWDVHQMAEERAASLLREHLSERQYRQFRRDGYLEIPSQVQPGWSYRLPARPGRVTVYEDGAPIGQLCVIASEPVPHADLILAQKWLIEADEPAYLALANWVSGSPHNRTRRELELLHT